VEAVIEVALAGLAAGYLAYLLAVSDARPHWYKMWQYVWAIKVAPRGWEGKPFSCLVCMSFWLSALAMLPRVLWQAGQPSWSQLAAWAIVHWAVEVFAASAVALLIGMTLGALRR
jgi:hypothetical protein